MLRDTCFSCKKPGHWAKDCPDRQLNKPMSSSTSPPVINSHAISEKQCPVCGGTCLFLTSHTEKNPGRKFYKCSNQLEKNCKFFEWYDQASPDKRQNSPLTPKPHLTRSDQRLDTPLSSYPECACGAGTCKLLTANTKENKGRKYFACPVQKGQGACNFHQWQDYVDENETNDAKKGKNINDLNGIISPVSTEKRIANLSPRGYAGSHSCLDDDLLPPFEALTLDEKKTTSVVVKPGKCYRCGEEGHWIKECPQALNSPCFKCGEIGHWVKNCTT